MLMLLSAGGCARRSGLMDPSARDGVLARTPPDKAVVVFLRPA
jgi:hypothetical protein